MISLEFDTLLFFIWICPLLKTHDMTRENIKKAAQSRCDRRFSYLHNSAFFDGFIAGAEWRINSVWHSASEKPQLGELIIVEVYGKIWEYGKSDVCDTNHPAARWAYIKDLIPNTED